MAEPPPSYEAFLAHVEQPWQLRLADDRVIEVLLTECVRNQAEGGPASFSLTFKAGPDAPIEQATYLLSADGFGPTPIFLVPLRQLPDGMEYHAVFTTSTKDESPS
ncbi:MAG: hypothetical protein M3Y42_06935 [Actinomycetota bacterium]|nr:hypothetical protein [Actinomycetota bacterium]MDQ2956680.1 hypothetical protein [Actinomycetota bacterium]